jgi:hypothetical protein
VSKPGWWSPREMERRSATACNCVLSSCEAACRYLRMFYHTRCTPGVHPLAPFGFLPSTKASERNVLMRRVRAHCTNCELCAENRCLVCTLAICWDLPSF